MSHLGHKYQGHQGNGAYYGHQGHKDAPVGSMQQQGVKSYLHQAHAFVPSMIPQQSQAGLAVGNADVFAGPVSTVRISNSHHSNTFQRMSHFTENGYRYEDPLQPNDNSGPSAGNVQKQAEHGSTGIFSAVPQSYVTHKELGTGGAGKAFLVTGKIDGERYVSKQILCLGQDYKAAPASYALHETRLLFLLQHPHIVQLKDFYPKSSHYCIVMEFCENGDLGQHIEQAILSGGIRFDTERIFTWWYQMLDGIDYCHSKGVLHRDLKPKNIFLDANMDIKIGDFGVSALTSFPPSRERVGTVRYHAPEVISSLHYSTKSDIWSIGCIVWEAITLSPPSGEPINLHNMNLALVPKMYGSATRDLLVMHLGHDLEHRPSASAIKEAMLNNLSHAGRQLIQSIADASAYTGQSALNARASQMLPRRLTVPGNQEANLDGKVDEQPVKDPGTLLMTALDEPGLRQPLPAEKHFCDACPDPCLGLVANATEDQSLSPVGSCQDATGGLGIVLAAGEGGELGAWKIIRVEANKPASLSGNVSVGEYLWEVNGKVIFGMPYQLITSLFETRNGSTKIGLKTGLGQPMRHIVFSKNGPQGKIESWVSKEDQSVRINKHNLVTEDQSVSIICTTSNLGVHDSAEGVHDSAEGVHDSAETVDNRTTEKYEPAGQRNMTNDDILGPKEGVCEVMREHESTRELQRDTRWVESFVAVSEDSQLPTASSTSELVEASDPRTEVTNERKVMVAFGDESFPGGDILAIHGGDASVGEDIDLDHRHPIGYDASKPMGRINVVGENMSVSNGVAIIAGDGQYNGELLEGKPSGRGTAAWPNQGHTYVGEWRNGVMHGQGTATYLNGDRYDGEWSQGKRSGLGRYVHGSGDVFEGLWSNERKHGLGVDTFADGRGYRGEFRNNKFAGVGTYYTGDGAVYQAGKAHGTGISTSTQGGTPAFVQYSHGNLIKSEGFVSNLHRGQQSRVELQSKAAIKVALQARRIASAIQGADISSPETDGWSFDDFAVDSSQSSESCCADLSKAIFLLTGIKSDENLVIGQSWELRSPGVLTCTLDAGDLILGISRRTSSWFQGMGIQEIVSYLQASGQSGESGTTLEISLCSPHATGLPALKVVHVPSREYGFTV